MNRVVLAIVVSMCGLVASEVEACGRCGLFGRACRFQHHHVQAVAVAPIVAAAPEVFVVNNVYPPANGGAALLAQQGGTVYGLQAAAIQYRVDPAETLRQAAELARGAQRLAETGLNGYQTSASLALQLQASTDDTLAKGVAASAVLSAAGLNPAQQQASQQTLRITRGSDGRWAVEQYDAGEAASVLSAKIEQRGGTANQQQPVVNGPAASSPLPLVTRLCASCHGTEKAEPAGGLYIHAGAGLDCEQALKAIKAVSSGKMPNGQALDVETRAALIAELTLMNQE